MIPSVVASQIKNCVADYLRTTFQPTTHGFKDFIDRFLATPDQLYKGPYINIGLPFQPSDHQGEFFPEIPLGFHPHRHQAIAFERLSPPNYQSTIIATGTGSGKTECFLLPILEHCRQQQRQQGIKAILIYPMNALATDQAKRLAHLIHQQPHLKGKVTAGLYVGDQESNPTQVMTPEQIITDRYGLRTSPPDILLTNYKMLDLLLMKPEHQKLWRYNQPETLRYLVVDEFHTFDGAQGTDLACLLRRLKYHLQTPANHLACVGTSATLGSAETQQEMMHYAEAIFQETFTTDSLVTENRLTVQEFLQQDHSNDSLEFLMVSPPGKDHWPQLQSEQYDDPKTFLTTQAQLWLQQYCPPFDAGEAFSTEWQLALGKTLKRLPLIHNLFRFFEDKSNGELVPRTYDEFGEKLASLLGITYDADPAYVTALIDSLFSLMAIARTAVKKQDGGVVIVPWVTLRIQVWFRELRRMVASVEAHPRLLFSSDLQLEELNKTLPILHCRHCGATGWAGLRPQQGVNKLRLNDLSEFYKAFFAHYRHPNLAYVFPCGDSLTLAHDPTVKNFCPNCFTLNVPNHQRCQGCGQTDLIRVQVPEINRSETQRDGQKVTIASNDCPYCKSANGLSILGAQSASLTSAMIGVLFSSPFNTDKKLLTFSDSVQDAAHRAGFYSARTYRTTLRTAIAQYLQTLPTEPALADFIPQFCHYWQEYFPYQADYVATFLPSDLAWLRKWDSFLNGDQQELPSDNTLIEDFLTPRLAWEIMTQFGYRAAVGPSLERSGICYVGFGSECLQQAAKELQQRLSNEIEWLRQITVTELLPYLVGFLHHLRLQGAIFQAATKSYVANGGNVFLLGKPLYMPNIGPGNPKPIFLVNASAQAKYFELLATRSKQGSWSEDWAQRCLSISRNELLLRETLIEILHHTTESLEASGLLKTEKCGKGKAWGLSPQQLYLRQSPQMFACDQCGSTLTEGKEKTDILQTMPCLKRGCSGHYQPAPQRLLSYYQRLYQTGEVQRIYALEHTGLLQRERRERLENRFIAGDRRCDPNLLSATSTLEMGINIGDLSSVVLCSMPPNTANFQQRLGRAGRTDGNAFATAIANAKPHDLYFYSNPIKMIRGNVNPAGCYLDASAILARQLTAFCLDNWVRQCPDTAEIPHKLRDALNGLSTSNKALFPLVWLDYVEQHQDALLAAFLGLFDGNISHDTASQLKAFIHQGDGDRGGLRWRILNQCFEAVGREMTRLNSQVRSLQKKIKSYKAQPGALQQEDHLDELEREKQAFSQLLQNLQNKQVLNFLTDEGFLPNYTFPESGVTLRSIIWRKVEAKETNGKRYEQQTLEYERPGRIAIRELLPGGSFYAEGRRVTIDQVDLKLSEPQNWRFCPSCSYATFADLPEGKQKTCPRCQNSLWSDHGQVHKMLKLKQVFARTADKNSRFGDDREDRQVAFFQRYLTADFDPTHREQTLLSTNKEFPFGLEYLSKTTFREINFGESQANGDSLAIAGQKFTTTGFKVCGGCGKVMNSKDPKKNHTINCQYRENPDQAKILEVLYLYRDFESEAIRFLMPDEDFWTDKGLHSFIAILQLGLNEHFKGRVDHLQVMVSTEPQTHSSLRKSFLYLYDSIPGGTGYLKQLIKDPDKLKMIFLKAQKILTACGCEDGCYECLFAYRNSFHQDQTSRNTAKKLLKTLLNHWDTLTVTDQPLSSIKLNINFDSELEKNFIEALKKYRFKPELLNIQDNDNLIFPILKKEIFDGQTGYLLQIGLQKWRIATQVILNEKDNVAIQSKADFVFYPLGRNSANFKPLVIFTDGWEYHQDRLLMDFEQRLAILRSQNYWCWSLTWEDVNNHYQEEKIISPLAINALNQGVNEKYLKEPAKFYQQYQSEELRGLENQDSFVWLMHYLAQPNHQIWQQWALLRTAIQADLGSIKDLAKQADWDKQIIKIIGNETLSEWNFNAPRFIKILTASPELTVYLSGDLGRHQQRQGDATFVLIHLHPETPDSTSQSLKLAWQETLRLFNLYQFLDYIYWIFGKNALTPELIVKHSTDDAEAWEDIKPWIMDQAVLMGLPQLIAQGFPVPEPGYELEDLAGEVVASAELAWINAKVALTTTAADQQQFLNQGWQSWRCTDFFDQLPVIFSLLQE